jgi:predicted CDP-diglyceride synthetase/phosphatidate cytidylyltransferase
MEKHNVVLQRRIKTIQITRETLFILESIFGCFHVGLVIKRPRFSREITRYKLSNSNYVCWRIIYPLYRKFCPFKSFLNLGKIFSMRHLSLLLSWLFSYKPISKWIISTRWWEIFEVFNSPSLPDALVTQVLTVHTFDDFCKNCESTTLFLKQSAGASYTISTIKIIIFFSST